MEVSINEDVTANKLIIDWLAGKFLRRAVEPSFHSPLSEFRHRCIATLQRAGDEASDTEKRDEAVSAYFTPLLLNPSNPHSLLMKWAKMVLTGGSAHEALNTATKAYIFLTIFRKWIPTLPTLVQGSDVCHPPHHL